MSFQLLRVLKVNFGSPSMREERKKSNIRRPDDVLRSVADKAASVLSAARKTAEVCRRQVDEKMGLIEVSRMLKPFRFVEFILKFGDRT